MSKAAVTKEAKKPQKIHPVEVRWAVIAAILAGETQQRIAEMFDIDQSTVSRWKSNIREELAKMSQEQRDQIEINIFITIIKTQHAIQAQLNVFSDPQWLKRQTAAELGILHGILHDKSIRLLEAIAPAEPGNAPGIGSQS